MRKILIILLLLFLSKILFSQDGWYQLKSPTNNEILNLDFKDKNEGVICDNSNIYYTLDGGLSFNNLTSSLIGKIGYYNAIILSKNNIFVKNSISSIF